jgi:hypothetical protein
MLKSWRDGCGRQPGFVLRAVLLLGLLGLGFGGARAGLADDAPSVKSLPVTPESKSKNGEAATAISTGAESTAAESAELTYADVPASGTVEFRTNAAEAKVPAIFRLKDHDFSFKGKVEGLRGAVRVSKITFPSPVTTDFEENNTVPGMYFQPAGKGPFPGVVVLHILGGSFPLSETVANALARKGVAALFIKMPYYGERRRAGNSRRMMSSQVSETVAGMTQAALDIRRATAWLRSRPEIDDEDLGITGISLGGLMSTIGAAAEPRIRKVGIQLAGGQLAQAFWDNPRPEAGELRKKWEQMGGTRESFIEALIPVEPTTYGPLLRDRHILMLAARQDEVFPEASTVALWKSIGEPQIIWLEDAGHYTSLLYIMRETERLAEFLKKPLSEHEMQAAALSNNPSAVGK